METIRQGDLLFVPIVSDELPASLKKRENGIIAEGEATGHHHRLAVLEDAEVFGVEGWRGYADAYVRVGPNGVSIVHEEHHTVTLPPNTTFRVHIAREFDYTAGLGRRVID